MGFEGQENAGNSTLDLQRWMALYKQADPQATADLIAALSPALLRFFQYQVQDRSQADDLLQETWLRIHRVRHTYRPGEPLLPWVYAIARRVRIDGYRKRRRISMHETAMDVLPERSGQSGARDSLPDLDALLSSLPEEQRELLTMLKVTGLSLEEAAHATSSTVGAVKQKVYRAYKRLRKALAVQEEVMKSGAG